MTSGPMPSPGSRVMLYRLVGGAVAAAAHLILAGLRKCLVAGLTINAGPSSFAFSCTDAAILLDRQKTDREGGLSERVSFSFYADLDWRSFFNPPRATREKKKIIIII